MSFVKQGELIEILGTENADSCVPAVSPEVLENFKKFANNLKKIAPKAEDFLYFSAVMMHAAEAAGLNDDGTPRLTAKAEPVRVGWDKSGNTWKWLSNDPSIRPYKNSNGDIFPEEELVKAHKKWVHKPLCIDHKSSSVDHVRGFIVDTYYDRNLKRVIALCALDKAGYPQLARQVSTGVSTSVSMGTAVGRAICTESGCHRVARTEADFCGHMKAKSGYGEINIDLNPLELSIVVNGADPRASIKHIIAAANTLNNYVENKAQQLAKLADLNFHATLQLSDPQGQEGLANTSFDVNGNNIEQFKADLDQAMQRLAEIASSASKISEKDTNHTAYNQSSGALAMSEGAEAGGENSELAPPHERYASADGVESISSLREIVAAVELKLSHMKQNLDKLTNASINKQEEHMSGSKENIKNAYYQGTEEPTPGQAKYPKDPLNEQLREKEDKQMVGEPPFPGVGDVDGLHPSPSSADPSNELERKKMLARAQAEENALRRQAIVQLAKEALQNKTAYFQNGLPPNNPNTPTPNKTKYPIDKLNEYDRDHEDKQMVGQPPFPGVGKVDGLHPSPQSADQKDELKRKELLRRASLWAKFVKAHDNNGKLSPANSAWEVYRGDQLLVAATVNELSGGNTNLMYDSIATQEFGSSLIEKIKAYGVDGVRALVKKAQDPAAAGGAPPPPAAGPADGGTSAAPPADGGSSAPPAEDTGKSGDPKENVVELAEKARDVVSDLVEGVRALTGEQAEMGDMGAPGAGAPPAGGAEMGAAASENFSTSTLNTLRRELNGALIHAMKESIAELNGHQQELEMISGMYDKGSITPGNAEFVGSIVDDAVNDAKTAIADGFKLMTAFVKYARGTKAIVKRAEIEAELTALAEGESMSTEKDSHSADSDLMSLIQDDTNSDLDDLTGLTDGDDGMGHEHADTDLEGLDMPADDNLAQLALKPGETVPSDAPKNVPVVVANLTSKAGRAAMRAKLAADALGKEDDGQVTDMSKQKFSDMLQEADHLADGQTQLDVKPSDSLGLVETLPEVNKAMLEVAKAPPKVRKEAEVIHRLVSEGKLDPADLDALVSEGLDKDAVAYYKKYFGEVEGGGEFASELVKEHVKAGMEAEINKFKIKLARSYELAYDMADRGLCHSDRVSVSNQVEEIMKFNDESFESLKKVVARHAPTLSKTAGRMPQVGILGGENNNPPQSTDDNSMYSQLTEIFAKSSKKGAF